jgi:glyoxylate/hydroxypyruvate reductase A
MHITVTFKGTKPEPWIEGLQTELADLPSLTIDAWQPGARPADYAVVWTPSQQFIDEQSRLKAIFNIGAGVDALLALRIPASTAVVRLDDTGMSVQMAEFVTHAVIRHFRELAQYDADMRIAKKWSYRKPLSRDDFPVGVMGLGILGERVARALKVFEYPVRGWSRSPKKIEGVECFSGTEQLDAFLAGTRILVCLLPLTAETENILNRRTLSQLLPDAYLINVARGAHLVEDDLLALLQEERLAGAALDVYRNEPLPSSHPFWNEPKITLTPHTSARTLRDESIRQIAGKIRALEAGEKVAGVVDPAKGY